MKLKKNKKVKKEQEIESLVFKALNVLNTESLWTWTMLAAYLGTDNDYSMTGNVIHRLKRNGVLRRLPEEASPGVCRYSVSQEHLLKMKNTYK